MSRLAKTFASTLHSEFLKGLGFQKSHLVFSRSRGNFTEYFAIDPASWNRPGEPWTFHLNEGISYFDIPAKLKGLIQGAHAATRHATITTTLINPTDPDSTRIRMQAEQVAEIISTRSAYLLDRRDILRHSYDRSLLRDGFPIDPDLTESLGKQIHLG